MTPKEVDAAADKMVELIERATVAIRANDMTRAGELMRQVKEIADTLPKKRSTP